MGNLKKLIGILIEEENIPLNRMREYLSLSGYKMISVTRGTFLIKNSKPKKYTKMDYEEIKKLRAQGLSYRKIGERLNIPFGSVPHILKQFELDEVIDGEGED